MNTDTTTLQANVNGFFEIGATVYQITGVYGQCFKCYEYNRHTKHLQGAECLISARMVLGRVELSCPL